MDQPVDAAVNFSFATSGQSAFTTDDFRSTSGTLTFAPGETSKEIEIEIYDSLLIENTETFLVTLDLNNLENNADIQIADAEGEVTIIDNDRASVSIQDISIDESRSIAVLIVRLDREVNTTVSVDFATADQTAVSPDDYLTTSGTLTFNPRERQKQIYLTIVDNSLIEPDKSFLLNLSNLVVSGDHDVSISNSQAVITIQEDDYSASISIDDLWVDESAGVATVTVAFNQPVEHEVSIDYTTSNRAATSPDDYLAQSGTLTFTPGEQFKTISIPIIYSNLVEDNTEIFMVDLSNIQAGGGRYIFEDNQVRVYIEDHDLAKLTVSDLIVNENEGTASIILTLDNPVNLSLYVDVSIQEGTAISNSDFDYFSPKNLYFTQGKQVLSFDIPIVNSDLVEDNEVFYVNLNNFRTTDSASSRNIIIEDNRAIVTILDDDQAHISINDLTINEAAGTAEVIVSLDKPVDTAISLEFTTADQSAIQTDDYIPQSGTLNFDAGQQTKTISIPLINFDMVEADEKFLINLSNLQNNGFDVIFVDQQSEITITDNDQASISIDDLSVNESEETAILTVSLDKSVSTAFSVDFSTADQSAFASEDYINQTGTVTFNPGALSQTFSIPLIDSHFLELDKLFLVNLSNIQSNSANVVFTDTQAEVTILDDDQASLSINDLTIDESVGTATLTVSLNQPVETVLTVDFATADQTTVNSEDYLATSDTLTFSVGEQTKTITVSIVNSDQVESDETFLLNLTNLQANGADVILLDNQAEVTINDDDQAKISINDISVDENAGTATLTVSLDRTVDSSVSVNFATADQTAIDPEDYLTTSSTLFFGVGEQSKTITISIIDSDLVELDETFLVNLTHIQANGQNIIFANNQSEVTIIDDEIAAAEVDLRIVNAPTTTESEGAVPLLPDNQNEINEWTTYWVEIWVNANGPVDQGIFSAQLDLSYNTNYTSATEIQFGDSFTQNQAGSINDVSGMIENLYAETTGSDLGTDSYLLFARIKFEPLAEDQVELDISGKSIGPYDLGFHVNAPQVKLVGAVPVTTTLGHFNGVSIYANPYDFNDDDAINFRDLVILISIYNSIPSQSNSDYAWFADYNKNNRIDFRDLVLLISNYEKSKMNHAPIVYPNLFPIGWNDLVTVNAQTEPQSKEAPITQAAAETVLESAVEQVSPQLTPSENTKLENIDIQIVDLKGDTLGRAIPGTIYIDVNAAGYGWFVDSTPTDHSEFEYQSPLSLIALPDSDAAGRVDLLSVIMHEISHILGHDHEDEGLMEDTLAPGVRKLPSEAENTDSFFSSLQNETELVLF